MSNDATAPTETAAPHGATGLPYTAHDVRTERLLLRPLNTGDLQDEHAYQNLESVVRYLHWEVHDPEERAEHLRKRIAMKRMEKNGDGIVFAVELPASDGGHSRVIGHVSVFVKSAKWAQIEIGWVFHPAIHGRGYATEALRSLVALSFEEIGAHRVFAQLDPRNEVAARLCENLGMRQEALLREREIVKGEWSDTAIYGVLEHEQRPEA